MFSFKLLPRPKNIGAIQLYAPGAIQAGWPRLGKILQMRPIDWDLITRNYDQWSDTQAPRTTPVRPLTAPVHGQVARVNDDDRRGAHASGLSDLGPVLIHLSI